MELQTPKPVTLSVQDVTIMPNIKFTPKPVKLKVILKEIKDGQKSR